MVRFAEELPLSQVGANVAKPHPSRRQGDPHADGSRPHLPSPAQHRQGGERHHRVTGGGGAERREVDSLDLGLSTVLLFDDDLLAAGESVEDHEAAVRVVGLVWVAHGAS